MPASPAVAAEELPPLPGGTPWPALNPDQRRAVTASLAPQLVVAGPGTGKTRVLVCRAAYLLQHPRLALDPAGLAVITFTTKAAAELKRRLRRLVGRQAQHVRAGTIHHFCYDLLRAHPGAVDVPDGFVVADDAVTDAFWQDWHRAHGGWCKAQGLKSYRAVKLRVSRIKLGLDTLAGDLVDGMKAYDAALRQRGALDFDDLLVKARDLLLKDADALGDARAATQALLVDEFQDTDGVQFRVLQEVAGGGTLRVGERPSPAGCHLFCVADDDQSIYRFRGARPRNLHDYVAAYGCTREAGTRHVLTTNYRSNRAIYAVAESVLDAEGRLKRRGEVRTQDPGTRPVTLTRYDDEPAEVAGAVAQVRAWTEEAGIPRDAVAVLAPWNARVEELEDAFLRAGIPCETSGGRALMETRPVRRLQAAFRLVDGLLAASTRGLDACDDALAELLGLELDDETTARVLDLWRGLDGAPLWAVFQRLAGDRAEAEARGLSAADHDRLAQLYATVGNLTQTARQPGQTVGGLADAVTAALGAGGRLLRGPGARALADPLACAGVADAAARLRAWARGRGRLLLFDAAAPAGRTPRRLLLWRAFLTHALRPDDASVSTETDDAPVWRGDGGAAACWVGGPGDGALIGPGDLVLTDDPDAFAAWAARRRAPGAGAPAVVPLGRATAAAQTSEAQAAEAQASGDAPPASATLHLLKLAQAAAAPAAPDPLFPAYAMVDLETTSLDVEACRVVELAAVRVEQGRETDAFDTLVALPDDLSPHEAETLRTVCGFTDLEAAFAEAPPEHAAWERFCAFVEGLPLVAHNGRSFDFRVLQRLQRAYAGATPAAWGVTYDTLPTAARLLPDARSYAAEALRADLLGDDAPTVHRALADCRDQQRLLEALLAERLRAARRTALEPLLPLVLAALCYEDALCYEGEAGDLGPDAPALVQAAYRWALRDASPARAALRRLLPRPLPALVRTRPGLYRHVDEDALSGSGSSGGGAADGAPAPGADEPGLDRRLAALLAPYRAERVADGGLGRVLSHLALWGAEAEAPERRVLTLSTYHSAKGLEFACVLCTGVHADAFPPYYAADAEARRESRRLLYVGMTRAEEHLALSHARQGSVAWAAPRAWSPFLDTVPPALVTQAP